jgi:O-acetyl-ADP-ribose deacetylase (regulator of RNase III)
MPRAARLQDGRRETRSLEIAEAAGARSVAFPSISTGVYGYPVESAAGTAIETVSALLPKLISVKEVTFCCFSANDLAVYEKLLANRG